MLFLNWAIPSNRKHYCRVRRRLAGKLPSRVSPDTAGHVGKLRVENPFITQQSIYLSWLYSDKAIRDLFVDVSDKRIIESC